ncbi:hypothetical protein [Bacilliculturomica massiliensis]|uniref:hypothetical protein n=1 Tax=Bacilliculturomica massiliensis TaxID=1917867 RepID=UPI001031E9F6|nr:hypothetical protein [Bacilliculturomica massiliensis]
MKRMIAGLLALILVLGPAPAGVSAAEDTELTLSNTYMKYTLNTKTGAFMVGTLEGHPQKAKDNNMPLLYDGGSQTSYTTVRIDGEDYVFGKDYGFLGLDSQLSQPVQDPGNQTLSISWTIKGIQITQLAELKSDAVNPLSGNVGLRYTVKNVGAAGNPQVGIRVLLDNALGENDAPFVIAEGGMPMFYESDMDDAGGTAVPTQLRFMDDYGNPNVMAYAILNSWSGAETPDRAVVGHWWNLANTKWDYTADRSMRFTSVSNSLNTADTASLYYFSPKSCAQGSERTLELMYGVGDFSYQKTENGPNVSMSFSNAPELNETGDGYKNNGEFTLSVKIDNTIDNAETHNNSVVMLNFEDNLEVIQKPSGCDASGSVLGIGIISPGDILTYEWTFRAKEQTYYISSEFVASLSTSLSEVLYRDYVLLPSVEGNLPDFTVDSMEPGEVYFRGTKMVTLKGSFSEATLKNTYGTQWNAYFENVDTGAVYQCVKSDVSFIGKNSDTLVVRYSGDMAMGTYRLVFRFTGGLAGLFDNGSGRIIPDGTLLVSNNPELVTKTYGVLTVMRTGNRGTSYVIVPFETEEEFEQYVEDRGLRGMDCPYEEIMLELRGAVKYYDDGSDQFYYADPNDDQVTINNILTYGNTDELLYLTEIKDNGSVKGIRVHGGGDLGVVGGMTFFKWGFEIQFDNGFYYTHNREKLENVDNPQKELLTRDITIDATGGMGILQKVAGFLFQLNYGTLTEDWSSLGGAYDPEESKGYAVNFGGKVALNFFEIPGLPGGGDEEEGGGSGSSGGTEGSDAKVPVPTPEADSGNKPEEGDKSGGGNPLNSLAGLGASVAIDDIMFGQKKDGSVGFLGINTTVEASLPEAFFGDMVKAGPSMTLTINTIDNVYSIQGGVGLKVVECSATLSIKMLPVSEDQKVKIPVPDSMEFGLGGLQSVRIIPPVMSLNALEGGISDIYDTLSGNFEGLPPVTIKLGVGVDLFEVLRGGGEIRISPRSFYGEATLGMANIPSVTLKGIFEAQWASPFYATLTGQVEILSSAIVGGVTVHMGDGELRGVLFGNVNVPDIIPIMGGMQIANAEGYLSTRSVGASAKFMGDYVNVVYYWGSDGVDVSSGSEPMYAPGSMLDSVLSARAEGAEFDTEGRVLYGSNISPLAVNENGAPVFGSGRSGSRSPAVFGDETEKSLSFTVDDAMAAASTLFIEIPYAAAPAIGDVKLTADGAEVPLTQADLTSGEGNFMINSGKQRLLLSVHSDKYSEGTVIKVGFTPSSAVDTENYAVYGAGAVARLTSAQTSYSGSGGSFRYTTATEGLKDHSQLQVYLTENPDALETLEAQGRQAYSADPERKNQLGTPVNSAPITGSGISGGTLPIPDTLATGTYYAVYSLMTEGETAFTCVDKANPISWTNAEQPSPLSSAVLIPAGDGAFRVSMGGIERAKAEGVTDLFVELKDGSGHPVPGYEMLRSGIEGADNIYVGGGKTVSGFLAAGTSAGVPETSGSALGTSGSALEAGGSAVRDTYAIRPLTPGESYHVTVTPAKFAPQTGGAYDENRVFYGSSTDSAPVELPAVNTPKLIGMQTDALEEKNGSRWLKGDRFTAKYTFDQDVRLSLTVNGSVYSYPDEYKSVWEVSVPLEDGDHSVVYTARNRGGDTARSDLTKKEGVFAFTKDTTAPILFTEGGSIITASAVTGGLKISGVSERAASIVIRPAEGAASNMALSSAAAAGSAVSNAAAAQHGWRPT